MPFAAETVTDEWAVNERETGAGRPALVFTKAQTTLLVIFSGQGPIKSAACWDVGSRMCLHRDPFTLPGVHNQRQPTDNGSMATYGYRCVEDGDFDIRRALGTAPTRSVCPVCNNEAARVFRPPMLSLAPRALLTAIDRTEKSGDEPDVVSTVPPRRVTGQGLPAPQNAAWQRLPRP